MSEVGHPNHGRVGGYRYGLRKRVVVVTVAVVPSSAVRRLLTV